MKEKIIQKFNSEFFVNLGVVVVCVFSLYFFSAKNVFQQVFTVFSFLLLTPLIYAKVILKRNIKDYGLGIGDYKKGLILSLISFVSCFLIFYVIFQYSQFPKKYYQDFFGLASKNYIFFLFYEIVVLGFYFFIFEVFFKGFVLFSFKNIFGKFVIFFQLALLVFALWISSGLNILLTPYLVFSIFGGITAYYGKSIWYSYLGAIIFNILFDITIINIFK